jgi:hypothetical protein
VDYEDWLKRRARYTATEERLSADLDRARERLRRAKEELDASTSAGRETVLNHTNGAQPALQATREYDHSQEEYHLALQRFCDFILRGEIPPDEGPRKGS